MAYDEDLANRIRELLAGTDGVTEKKMFGGLAFLVGGHMSVAASGQGGLLIHCEREQTDALLEQPHTSPMVMRGRPVDGWLRVDADGVESDRQLRSWVERGLAHARSLPSKS
ncbi:MAG: hypothetical protein QOK21_4252 [Solirubrobacteraceae bacterium]|nr:hypothetical protein [Solirubrobacteraceae bacterium]